MRDATVAELRAALERAHNHAGSAWRNEEARVQANEQANTLARELVLAMSREKGPE